MFCCESWEVCFFPMVFVNFFLFSFVAVWKNTQKWCKMAWWTPYLNKTARFTLIHPRRRTPTTLRRRQIPEETKRKARPIWSSIIYPKPWPKKRSVHYFHPSATLRAVNWSETKLPVRIVAFFQRPHFFYQMIIFYRGVVGMPLLTRFSMLLMSGDFLYILDQTFFPDWMNYAWVAIRVVVYLTDARISI